MATYKLLVLCISFVLLHLVAGELKQLHILYRHGERTPGIDNMYPNDPYLNDEWYPYGLGELTNRGKANMYNKGFALRFEYDEFLGQIYKPELLYARSTDYSRAKMTMQLVLAGLWKPSSVQQFTSNLDWQPVPYDYIKYADDKLLGFPIYYCDDLIAEYQAVSNTDEVKQYLADNAIKFQYVNNNTGLKAATTLELMELYFGLVDEEKEKPLPPWVNTPVMNFLKDASEFEYKIQTSSPLLIKATGGPLLKKILQDIDDGINANKFTPKLSMYAGHEYNVAYVLATLGVYKPHIPDFGSHIIFELHQFDDKFGIKVVYKHGEDEVMILPGCTEFCELGAFKSIVKDMIPETDWCW